MRQKLAQSQLVAVPAIVLAETMLRRNQVVELQAAILAEEQAKLALEAAEAAAGIQRQAGMEEEAAVVVGGGDEQGQTSYRVRVVWATS